MYWTSWTCQVWLGATRFMLNQNVQVAEVFITLIGCYAIDLTCKKGQPQPLDSLALELFRELARAYRKCHDRPPVLVFDNVNYLARQSPELRWVLQQLAKGLPTDLILLSFVFALAVSVKEM